MDTDMTVDVTDVQNNNQSPKNLTELLSVVQTLRKNSEGTNRPLSGANALLQALRMNHYWPALQVKKFYQEPDLVLLHNTYKRIDVGSFQELYDECRSVVLDMSAEEGKNVIVTFAHNIPDRMTDQAFEKVLSANNEELSKLELSYEGTVVTVYNYKDKWYFGTSSCPNVNYSRYFHPTLTHGDMFDEALMEIFPEATKENVRDMFTSKLKPNNAYAFLLVHHENKHVMNYEKLFGKSDYKKLVHITTRDRNSLEEYSLLDHEFESIGIIYPYMFNTLENAINMLRNESSVYAIMATFKNGKRVKVSVEKVIHQEECDLGNPNKWHNMLSVYMQNRPDYHISNYEKEFAPDVEYPKDRQGREMTPTYLIHTVICSMRDVLYQMYCQTTTYYTSVKRFRMNKEFDNTYAPILRFHLAQLRHIQVQEHSDKYLTPKAIYHYLCFHQTLKNIRLLIKYFAMNPIYFKPRTVECFQVLNRMLNSKKDKENTQTDTNDTTEQVNEDNDMME